MSCALLENRNDMLILNNITVYIKNTCNYISNHVASLVSK